MTGNERYLKAIRDAARSMPNEKERRAFIEGQRAVKKLPLVIKGKVQDGQFHEVGGITDEVYNMLIEDLETDLKGKSNGR